MQVLKSEKLGGGDFLVIYQHALGGDRHIVFVTASVLTCTALVRSADDVPAAERMCRSLKLKPPPGDSP